LLTGGAVLKATTLVEQGTLQQYDRCLGQLKQLQTGKLLPSKLASEWSGDQERQILEWWLTWTQDLIRWKQAGKQPLDQQTARNLQQLAETVDCRRLFDFSGKVADALKSLGSGLNQQLVLEDLLISWSRLSGEVSKTVLETDR
jgi:DNA polymerase-3 subunit delta'